MEKVCNRFVKGLLAGGPGATVGTSTPPSVPAAEPAAASSPQQTPRAYQVAGMETVAVTHGFHGDLESMVEFTRTLDSRANWPGAVLEYEEADDTLYYGVGMRLNAATMTDVTVEEKLGDVDRLEGGEIRYTAVHRILWPEGHADGIVEYLFRPGRDGGSNYLRFTYSYTPPSTKLVKIKELPAFRLAMEKVSTRYLDKLTRARPR